MFRHARPFLPTTLKLGHNNNAIVLPLILKGHSSPETSVAYIKDLYEPTLKWPFVPLKCFSLPRNLTLLY